ncbi:MAG TPA: rod shape-determining protein MreC [Rickettsiales bacterium]|nr:rod shape-determining protein MreC [Rickettsiales bacterium]
MKHNYFQTSVLTINYRPIIARLAVMSMLIASIWLVSQSKNHSDFERHVRMGLADVLAPAVNVLAKPLDTMAAAGAWVQETIHLRDENATLRYENARLREAYSSALQIKTENERLRALLKFAPVGKQTYTSARVAVDAGGLYSRSVLITSGTDNGVQQDSAVINDKGMVGRVIEAGDKTSRVLLLTDINSRIPVMAEGSREHAIVAGDDSDTLSLLYLPENSKLKVGEKIVTSSDGALLAPGLPIGIVTAISKDKVTVKPYVDWYRLEYISVINF